MKVISNLIEAHVFRITGSGIEFLLLKRSEKENYPNIWQMVTGSIENEKAYETTIREIKEETGLGPEKMWVVPKVNSFYSHELDYICLVPVFVAQVFENQNVTISDEHCEFKWVNREEAKKLLAWPGQRDSVDVICEYFTNKNSVSKFIEITLPKI